MNIAKRGLISRPTHVRDERIKESTAGARRISVPAIAKRNSNISHYCVPNEYICAEIGRRLGLPIPPGAIIIDADTDAQHWYAVLDFSHDGEPLEIVSPEDCFRILPDLCVGIVLFDIFIANDDRNVKNLYLDETRNLPEIRLFDHENALLGAMAGQAEGRLTGSLAEHLGIGKHCLKHLMSPRKLLDSGWIEKITELPNSFLEYLCRTAEPYGITSEETATLLAFLIHRRDVLKHLISRYEIEFSQKARS